MDFRVKSCIKPGRPVNIQTLMKRKTLLISFVLITGLIQAQGPEVTSWLINTTGLTASHYVNGNPNVIIDADSANVQRVYYSTNWVYVFTKGLPAYPTGPFLDGNPSLATNQSAIFRISRNPVQNTGAPVNTTGGNIGIFINGVALFDYRDGVAWNPTTNTLCGGPGNPPCPGGPGTTQSWNRDAIPAERVGFDCSKGHPAMGNYHHHQNPSAFKLDLNVISTICNLYDADGLYAIDSTQHSPLIGYAYDGFPIYGAYAYEGTNGTGPIVRMKSGYHLRNITVRNTSPTGATVSSGPNVSAQYPLGYFREDYEYIAPQAGQTDVLDIHNGRFCVTPEYPNGTYAYFCTVDSNWNSAYPYVVGPTHYGTRTASKVTSINEPVTQYFSTSTGVAETMSQQASIHVFPNPGSDFIAVQLSGVVREDIPAELFDMRGRRVGYTVIRQGTTISYFDVSTLYTGSYLLKIRRASEEETHWVEIVR